MHATTQAAPAGQTAPASVGRLLPFPLLPPGTYSFKSSLAGAVRPDPGVAPGPGLLPTAPSSSQENKTPTGRWIPGWSSPAPRARSRMRRPDRERGAGGKEEERLEEGRREPRPPRGESAHARPGPASCSRQFSSVKSLSRLCHHRDCSTPGLPVHHQLPELTQTHVHRVGDAIQPPQPLSSPSPPALNLSPHQGLFQWVSSSHQVAKASILPMNIQDWLSLGLTGRILQSKALSRVFSNTTVGNHQFLEWFQPSLWFNSHIQNGYWKNHSFGLYRRLLAK